VAGLRIQPLVQIPIPLFTDNAWKLVVHHNNLLFKGIPPYNGLWQSHYNILSHQVTNHCHCNRGESLSKTHFFRHKCSWHISIPNTSPHDEPDGPNLVCQTPISREASNWICGVWNTVICWLTNWMSVQQPGCLIKKLMFKLILDCTENQIEYWAGICWMEHCLTNLQLLLNLCSTLICGLFALNVLVQLLPCQLGEWTHIPVLLKFIAMLGISKATIRTNMCGWNTINPILSIRTYVNTSIILLPTILLSLLSFVLFRNIQILCIMISSCAHLDITRLAGITNPRLITCGPISFTVPHIFRQKIVSDRVHVSTSKHLNYTIRMKSGHIWGPLSFTCWYIIPSTPLPIRLTPGCTSTLMS